MSNTQQINKKDISIKNGKIGFENKESSAKRASENPIYNVLIAERGENFYYYIEWLGLSDDPNLMILPSLHHYYYDFNDLKDVKTLINLKTLNQINHTDNFLNNIARVLPPGANFIGSFIDNKIHKGVTTPVYQSFRILNRIINLLDAKTDKFLTRKSVLKLLEAHGFKVLDMTEIQGTTYFCTQIDKKSD